MVHPVSFQAKQSLEEHSDDRHHRKAAIGQLGAKLFGLLSRIG